jgi:hypothetical protein
MYESGTASYIEYPTLGWSEERIPVLVVYPCSVGQFSDQKNHCIRGRGQKVFHNAQTLKSYDIRCHFCETSFLAYPRRALPAWVSPRRFGGSEAAADGPSLALTARRRPVLIPREVKEKRSLERERHVGVTDLCVGSKARVFYDRGCG